MEYKDYKISQIIQNSRKTTVTARFYEGNFADVDNELVGMVNQYKRTKFLEAKDFTFAKDTKVEDVRKYLNKELAKEADKYLILDAQKDEISI